MIPSRAIQRCWDSIMLHYGLSPHNKSWSAWYPVSKGHPFSLKIPWVVAGVAELKDTTLSVPGHSLIEKLIWDYKLIRWFSSAMKEETTEHDQI